jgi:hypothetical protein
MNKTKPKKFTFKNNARYTGLASVGAGTPAVNIKYAGVDVGTIYFNDDWNSNKDIGIVINLMVPRDITPNCSCKWKWVTLKKKFTSGDEAKTFLNDNFAGICKMIYIPKE